MNDGAEATGLAGAGDNPREALFGSNDSALRDDATAVVISVRRVADYIEDLEFLSLARLRVADVDNGGLNDLYLVDAGMSIHHLELLFPMQCLDGVSAYLVDAVSPVWPLLATRRLALC